MTNPPSATSLSESHEGEQIDPLKSGVRSVTVGKPPRFTFSEGLLIALAPAYAYLLTFQYEKGFTSYFSIPEQFIDVSLGNVLFLSGVALMFVVIYFLIVNGLVTLIPTSVGSHPLIKRHVITLGIGSTFLFIPAYLYDTRALWMLALSYSVLGILVYFVSPLILFRKEAGYMNKLEAARVRMDRGNGSTTLIGWSASEVNPRLIILGLVLVYFVGISHEAGRMKAAKQKEFLTASSSADELVLLRLYSDKLIFAPFDRNTRQVQKRFVILRVEDLKTPLTMDEVGPLTSVKPVGHEPAKPEMPQPVPSPSVSENKANP